jgi:hypothetical protein
MTAVQYADVRPMVMLDNALRREFRLLPPLVRGVPNAGTGRTQIVAGHIGFLTNILQAHHQGEDAEAVPIGLPPAV